MVSQVFFNTCFCWSLMFFLTVNFISTVRPHPITRPFASLRTTLFLSHGERKRGRGRRVRSNDAIIIRSDRYFTRFPVFIKLTFSRTALHFFQFFYFNHDIGIARLAYFEYNKRLFLRLFVQIGPLGDHDHQLMVEGFFFSRALESCFSSRLKCPRLLYFIEQR